MVNTYLHDGSPEGFLSALLAARTQDPTELLLPATGRAEPDLFAATLNVPTEPARSRAFLDELAEHHGPEVSRRLMYLYYSESPQAGALALAYLRLREQHGEAADQHLTHPVIRAVLPVCRSVGGEIHRLRGLLRFTELEAPALYARMEPDYNILMPVAFYFRRRLGGQPWLIADRKRQRAAHWDGTRLRFLPVSLEEPCRRSGDAITRLWRTFYRAVAIPGRTNEALRRQHMPERYWKYLAEL